MRLTSRDIDILIELNNHTSADPIQIAKAVGIYTTSPRETTARHLIKLTKMNLARKTGLRSNPRWEITKAGQDKILELIQNKEEAKNA